MILDQIKRHRKDQVVILTFFIAMLNYRATPFPWSEC